MGVSAIALTALAAPAMAQTAPPPAANNPPPVTDTQTVIVTAEKRAANLQQVPEAVSAFTAKTRDIEGINSIQDMTNFTPGLTYSSQLDRTQLRGIGRLSNLLSADASVAVYSDDFFTTSTTEAGRDTLFVDRDEILRGPQGTLYGRNAIGGAINIISKRPTDTPYAEVRVSYGNFDRSNVEAAVSGPIAPGLTARVAGYFVNQNQGYFKNLYPGEPSEGGVQHDWYLEGQLQYKNDNIDAWLKAFAQGWHNDRGGPGSLLFTPTTGAYDTQLNTPYDGLTFNPGFGYAPASNGFISSGLGAPGTPQSEPAGTPLNPIPGTVTGGCGVTSNPAVTNIRNFCHNTPTSIQLTGTYALDFHFTYHFPGFDVKYVTGYDQYHYLLTQDWDALGVTSYQIPTFNAGVCGASACPPFTAYPQESLRYPENNRWMSHEITFSSTTKGAVDWIAGLYYFDEHYSNPTTIYSSPQQTQLLAQPNPIFGCSILVTCIAQPNFANYSADYDMTTKSEAAYGQIDWHITDALKFTGGLRYTSDHKQGNEYYRLILMNGIPGGFGLPSGPISAAIFGAYLPAVDVTPYVIDSSGGEGIACLPSLVTKGFYAGSYTRCLSGSSDATTGTAGLEYSPDRDDLYYVRYSRGYKAFAFNAGTISNDPMSKPEFINAYEGGIKKTFPDLHLVVDTAVFYYDYIDAEIPIGVNSGGSIQAQFKNIPSSRSDGVEFQVDWSPIDHLNFTVSYSYDNTAILSSCGGVDSNNNAIGTCYIDASDPEAVLPGAHGVGPLIATTTGLNRYESVKGDELPQAPENKFAFNVNYTWEFDPGNFTLSASYVWKDKSYASIFNVAAESAPSWDEVDMNAMWSGDHDRYEILAYVKNLFNTIGYDAAGAGVPVNAGYSSAAFLLGAVSTVSAYDLTPPRTYGIEFRYKFF